MSSAAHKGSVKYCVFCSSVLFCEKKYAPSLWDNTQANHCEGFSLTEHTEFTELFWRTFRAHRTPPAYREHRAFLLKLAVRFCEFCRPQGLCEMLCVLFICVFLWEKTLRQPDKSTRFEDWKCKAISQSHPPLLSKRGSSTLKNTPFLKREHALLEARRRPSWGKKGVFSNAIRNLLISCRLRAWYKEIWPSYSENDELDVM